MHMYIYVCVFAACDAFSFSSSTFSKLKFTLNYDGKLTNFAKTNVPKLKEAHRRECASYLSPSLCLPASSSVQGNLFGVRECRL